MKSYVTSGTGSQQTLTGSQDEKVAVYQTVADAEADLANLGAGQIVATPDTGDENAQPVDAVTDGDMHAVTSNAVFDTYAVISASSTVITGKPISQRSVIKIMFTSAISGSDTTTAMSISYNGTSYPVKVGKNGSLANFTASEISSGTYRYLQAYTTLELAFDGTQFIIIGNPVVLSSADYTIYADGTITYSRSGTQKQINNRIYKTYGQFGLSFDEVANNMQLSYPLRLRIKFYSQDNNYFINLNVYKESAIDNPMVLITANTSGTNVNYNTSIIVPRYDTTVLVGYFIVENYV